MKNERNGGLRIAHINCVYGVTSTGRLISDLVGYGARHGHESRVFYSERQSDAAEAVRYISDAGRNRHALMSRLSGLQGYWSKAETLRLCAMLEDFTPDAVHLHVLHGNCVHLPTLFDWLHRRKVSVVVTLHDCWWFTGRCVYPTLYGCDGYTGGCAGCPAKRDVCPSWFFDRAAKMLRDKKRWLLGCGNLSIVAVSDWVARQAEASFLRSANIRRIYNWVDTDVFKPSDCSELRRSMGFGSKKVVLGVASKWEERKGLKDLCALAERLPEDYRLVIVGQIPPSFNLPRSITHIPATDSVGELAQLYGMAEVFVNPSKMETFGLTTAEAMACGTPSVVYDVTACPELIGDGTGAAVSPEGGCEGLLRAVLALNKTDERSRRCREWVAEQFSLEAGAAQYYGIYARISSGEVQKA